MIYLYIPIKEIKKGERIYIIPPLINRIKFLVKASKSFTCDFKNLSIKFLKISFKYKKS